MTNFDNLRRLDEICDSFELNWSEDSTECIGQLFQEVDATLKSDLLKQLLWVDLDMRFARSLAMDINLYERQVPLLANEIKSAYAEYMKRRSGNDTSKIYAPLESTNAAVSIQSPLQSNARLGKYHIETCIGSGGFGFVYLATELSTRRRVAIKVPNPKTCDLKLFIKEAIACAKLTHPSICELFYVEDDAVQPYIVYRFVEGPTLAELIRTRELSIDESIAIVCKLCDAFEYAHSKGVIHRDIKPGNVLLENGLEPVVTDFGLAEVYSYDASTHSNHGHVGTIYYSAPEQLMGADSSEKSDIFSLGVLLYELLARRRPFVGATIGQVTASVLKYEPGKPSTHNPEVPPNLDVVCLKAIKKDPKQRYQSMAEFRAALTPELRIPDKEKSKWGAVPIALGLVVGLIATFAIVTYRIATDVGHLVIEVDDPDVRIEILKDGELIRIVDLKTESQVSLRSGAYSVAPRGDENEFILSKENFVIARGRTEIVTIRREENPSTSNDVDIAASNESKSDKPIIVGQRILDRVKNPRGGDSWTSIKRGEEAILTYDDFKIDEHLAFTSLRWDGDIFSKEPYTEIGERVQKWVLEIRTDHDRHPGPIIATRTMETKSITANVIHTWTSEVKEQVWTISFEGKFNIPLGLAPGNYWCSIYGYFKPDSGFSWNLSEGGIGNACLQFFKGRMVLRPQDRSFELVAERSVDRTESLSEISQLRNGEDQLKEVDSTAAAQIRRQILRSVKLLDGTKEGLELASTLQGAVWPADMLDRRNISNEELSAAGDGDPGRAPAELVAVIGNGRWKSSGDIAGLDASDDQRTIVSASVDGVISVWDPATGQLRRSFKTDLGQLSNLRLNAAGNVLLCCSNRSAVLWDVAAQKQLRAFEGHLESVVDCEFSTSEDSIYTVSLDKSLRVWNLETGECTRELKNSSQLKTIAIHPSLPLVAIGGNDGFLKVVSATSDDSIKDLKLIGSVTAVDFSPNGEYLAACSDSGEIAIWKANEDFSLWRERKAEHPPNFDLRFSLESATLVFASHWECAIWNLETDVIDSKHATHADALRLVSLEDSWLTAWSSRWLAKFDHRGVALNADASPITAFSLSADSTELATTVRDAEKVECWSLDNLQKSRELLGNAKWDNAIGFTNDDSSLLTAGGFWIPKLWNVKLGLQPERFSSHDQWIVDLDVAADSKRFCTCGFDRTCRTWDIETGDLLQKFNGHNTVVLCNRFSPNSKLVVTTCEQGKAMIWDSLSGNLRLSLMESDSPRYAAAFRPFSNEVATTDGNSIGIYSLATGARLRMLMGHQAKVLDVDFSVDGSLVATSSADGTVRCWDASSGKLRDQVRVHSGNGEISRIRFTPDSRHVISLNGNGTVYIIRWNAGSQ